MNSATVLMLRSLARSVLTTMTLGTPATKVMGAKSLMGSNDNFSYSARLMPCVPTVPMSKV